MHSPCTILYCNLFPELLLKHFTDCLIILQLVSCTASPWTFGHALFWSSNYQVGHSRSLTSKSFHFCPSLRESTLLCETWWKNYCAHLVHCTFMHHDHSGPSSISCFQGLQCSRKFRNWSFEVKSAEPDAHYQDSKGMIHTFIKKINLWF